MKIVFTEEMQRTHHRARALRGGLIKNYHKVKVLKSLEKIPAADFWFHGITHDSSEILSPELCEKMDRFEGRIVFFGNDDPELFPLERIPISLRNKASLFLRSCWPSDTEKIDPSIKEKMGFVNPFIKPCRSMPGDPLKSRPVPLSFYGAPTAYSRFDRITALRMIKKAGLPFTGGLYVTPSEKEAPDDLYVSQLPLSKYLDTLKMTRLGLVFHGYSPLSFRLFECLAARCLAVVQDLSSLSFVDCGLKAGVHYVQIRSDLSDLVETVAYYLKNLDEAQVIADQGFLHFKKMFQYTGVDLPQPLYERITDSWKAIGFQKKGRITPGRMVMRMMLPYIHSL